MGGRSYLPLPFITSVFVLLALFGLAKDAYADLEAQESSLNPLGSAFEVNLDEQGVLWISDYDAGEIWGVDSDSGAYSVYAVGGKPSDARRTGEQLWWVDGESNLLGRLSTQDGTYSLWNVPGSDGFYGTGVDAQKRLWVNDGNYPYLYRLDPQAGELCTYTLSLEGMSSYLVIDGGFVWLGDWVNARLLRLDMDANTLDWWLLPEGSYPFGMALDENGNLWYADSNNGELARLELEPTSNRLRRYGLPEGSLPQMLAVAGENVWYTEQAQASLGMLNPQEASYEDFTPIPGSDPASPACAKITPVGSGKLAASGGTLSWEAVGYSTLVDGGGWRIYQLPDYSLPWGIAADDALWFVDSLRQVLGRVPIEETREVYLPLVMR